ncbi:MAG TPA: diacylglycerol kinase family protein [Chloroflexota bacterium]|nr:diacylglycerol kinase family protein [Chloroflexota bacterium]
MPYNAGVNGPAAAPLFVVNARAGAGRAGARWPALARELGRVGLAFEPAFTEAPGDATRLAAAAARAGRTVVAVGGDGTINEVVNGLMAGRAPGAPPPVLGVLPSGTAQDFARSAGIPLAPRAAIALLVRAEPRLTDVGRIRFGSGAVRYFANYAGAGFDAMVTVRAQGWSNRWRGALAYVLGFFAVLRGYENKRFELRPDGGPPLEPPRRINMVIVANGGNYAGVLRMAPGASLDDGLLDVVVIGDVGRFELLAYLPLALFGRHLEHPKVATLRVHSVAMSAGEPLPVQSDGEIAGELPAEFDVMPGALRLLRA